MKHDRVARSAPSALKPPPGVRRDRRPRQKPRTEVACFMKRQFMGMHTSAFLHGSKGAVACSAHLLRLCADVRQTHRLPSGKGCGWVQDSNAQVLAGERLRRGQ